MAQFINPRTLLSPNQAPGQDSQPAAQQAENLGAQAVSHALGSAPRGSDPEWSLADQPTIPVPSMAAAAGASPPRKQLAYGELIKDPLQLPGGTSEEVIEKETPFHETFKYPAGSWLNREENPDVAPGVHPAARHSVKAYQRMQALAHSRRHNAPTQPAVFSYRPDHPSNQPTRPAKRVAYR